MFKRHFLTDFLIIYFGFFMAFAVNAKPLETIVQIRQDESETNAVSIDLQVLCTNPIKNDFFASDGLRGIYVKGLSDRSIVENLDAGDVIKIVGTKMPGKFSPYISAEKITVLQNKQRPIARPFNQNELVATFNDCDWIRLKGRLLSISVSAQKDTILLGVKHNEMMHQVHLPFSDENLKRVRDLHFSFIECSAVVGTVANSNRQLINRLFYLNSPDDITSIGDWFNMDEIEEIPISNLMRYSKSANRLMKVEGLVVGALGSEIFLRGEDACLKVTLPSDEQNFEPGDFVSVEGSIRQMPISPALYGRIPKLIRKDRAPSPVKIDLSEKISDKFNYELVQVDAELIDYDKNRDINNYEETVLRCRSDGQIFEFRLPLGCKIDENLKSGAKLRLTGICELIRNSERQSYIDIVGFTLFARDENDIEILVPAPWFTPVRLLWISGGLLALTALFVVWISLLKKTVAKQTDIIREKIEQESISAERQRIARELHDTLEQGLTALSVQMKNIRSGFDIDEKTGARSLDLAENMLRVCRDESRASIIDLRGGILEKMSLHEAIKNTLEMMVKDRQIELHIDFEGICVSLNPFAERHILRLISEAANNSIKYAKGRHLLVALHYSEGDLRVSVRDDGCGFDAKKIAKGHFGVCGMRERANRLHGVFEVNSELGRGTEIVLMMPTKPFLRGVSGE